MGRGRDEELAKPKFPFRRKRTIPRCGSPELTRLFGFSGWKTLVEETFFRKRIVWLRENTTRPRSKKISTVVGHVIRI